MQGVPFYRTAEFWTAIVAIVAIVLGQLQPAWQDLVDQLIAPVTALIIALVVRSTVVQAVQFSRGRSFVKNRWEG